MRIIRLLTVSMIFAALFAVSAFAQAQPTTKIGVINTLAFGATKGGITKYVTQQTKLNNEFKPVNTQITTLATRINNLKKEISTLQKAGSKVPVANISKKAEQHDNLVRELKFKQENAKAQFESRSKALLGPITQDIFKAMQTYAKQKGYAMILDAAKLDNAGLILAFDRKFDVTKDFITYYNARPAGTASK